MKNKKNKKIWWNLHMPEMEFHYNLMSKHLTPDIFREYFELKTSTGFPFERVIQPGVRCPGYKTKTTVGCVAGDEESYRVFSKVFDPVIEDLTGFTPTDHHVTDLDPSKLIGMYAIC